MGWLAISGSAVVAAFAIHSFFSRSNAREPTAHDGQSPVDAEDSRPEPQSHKSLDQQPPLTPVLLEFSPPDVAVEKEEDIPLLLERTRSVPERPPQPSIMMPPPPVPPEKSSSPPRLKPSTFGSMPAPPRPSNTSVRPPPSAAASLRVPQTKVLSNTSMAPSLGLPKKKSSRQVILAPGYSPLDWAALTANPDSNMRGKDAPPNLIKITPSMLKQQNGRKGREAWTSFQGKVYNITPYLPFHPGGKGELMQGAGKDCTKLFMETHPWVNIDMLRECLVGIMVNEHEEVNGLANNSGGLDDMD